MRADENALMMRVAARDHDAFAQLVDAHAAVPQRVAFRMIGNAAEAEDIAQDALLKLWEHAGRWRSDGPGVAAWLTRVAVNAALDRLRRRRFTSEEAAPDREDDAPLADCLLDAARMAQTVRACIGALPDNQRAAIVLTYYEDMPNMQAADILGMNIKAFESLLFRARAALKRALAAAGLDQEGAA
jgi:RNA polymerase sigma-70 factor (ECF subfamily)